MKNFILKMYVKTTHGYPNVIFGYITEYYEQLHINKFNLKKWQISHLGNHSKTFNSQEI